MKGVWTFLYPLCSALYKGVWLANIIVILNGISPVIIENLSFRSRFVVCLFYDFGFPISPSALHSLTWAQNAGGQEIWPRKYVEFVQLKIKYSFLKLFGIYIV